MSIGGVRPLIPPFTISSTRSSIFHQGCFLWRGFHRMTWNLFGDFLLRRLLTDFRRCDLFGQYGYPLRVEKVPRRKICGVL